MDMDTLYIQAFILGTFAGFMLGIITMCVFAMNKDESNQVQDAFVKQQKRLPPDMEKLLHDNAWELYEK